MAGMNDNPVLRKRLTNADVSYNKLAVPAGYANGLENLPFDLNLAAGGFRAFDPETNHIWNFRFQRREYRNEIGGQWQRFVGANELHENDTVYFRRNPNADAQAPVTVTYERAGAQAP